MARKELDRFAKNYKKDIQIQTKLMSILIGSVVLACVVVCTLSIEIFNAKQLGHEKDRIQTNSQGVVRIVDDWKLQLTQYSYLFALNQDLSEAVYSNNNGSVKKVVDGITSSLDLDFFAVTDAKGKIMYADEISGTVSDCSVVANALRGQSDWGYTGVGSQNYSIVAADPIRYNGKVVGALILGYCLDNELLGDEAVAGYNVECTVFKNDTRVDTTIKDASGTKLVGTKLDNPEVIATVLKGGEPYTGTVEINKEKYVATYAPLVSNDGSVTGMVFVANSMKSLEEVRTSTLKIVIPVGFAFVLVLFLAVGAFVRWLMWRIKNVTNSLEEMATGEADLTKRCKLFIRDEIGFLVIHFDAFCDKLQQIIAEVKKSKDELKETGSVLTNSIDETSGAIAEISSGINNIHAQIRNSGDSVRQTALAVDAVSENITTLDNMIETQSGEVSEAATAVEEMIGNISSVNHSVEKMASSFEGLSQNAQMGFSKQQDVNERIKQIETQSEMLQEANLAISSIAEQTNLLAMNAAIEAAHAGEAGKGFSVVADEIRKLSETSAAQSKTIGEQLGKIKDQISEVVSASVESSEAFAAVSNKIKETDELVIQIKAAMEEQTSGSRQISQSLRSMNDSTAEVNKASKDMAQKNLIIQNEVKRLQGITEEMKSSMEEMAASSEKIGATGRALGDMSSQVQGSISKIGSQIDLFKV